MKYALILSSLLLCALTSSANAQNAKSRQTSQGNPDDPQSQYGSESGKHMDREEARTDTSRLGGR